MSSSSSKTATKDVFICSGSGSTRYSFVSHLSAALDRINISVIQEKDDPPQPESSEYVSKETQSALRGSKVRVVVLSEEFAFYKSSLSTLVEIIDRQHEKNCIAVVPVFYRVPRSVVEQQSERFHEAFTAMSSVPEEQVIKWRNALKETAHLEESLESKDGQSDLELVDEIVTYVHEKLFPTDKIGITSRLVDIENLINMQPLGVRSLGIWGMAGIGKTTIAEAAFNRMKGDYEHPRFIRDFEKKIQKKGLYNLREQRLPPNVKERLDVNKSIRFNKESQREKIVFLVLDDVRKPVNAESFLGGFDWFDQGSVIIITSRDKHVLVQCRVDQIYEVKKLDDKEALTLFSRCAFGVDSPEKDYRRVAEMVVKYAIGNAKALSYYGTVLKGKTPEEMEAAFFKLKRCPPPEILELFKSSYDELSDNEKNIFLDIACFYNGRSTEQVTQALKGRGLVVPIGIQYLLEKSFVTIPENRVEMHELIRDVAFEIINQEVKNGKGRRLCGAHNIQPLLEDKGTKSSGERSLVLEDIESILLDVSGLSFVVNPVAFQSMVNLRHLKIYSSDAEHHPGLCFQKGLVSLPSELRLLHWENYNLQNLPEQFNPQVLEELTISYSQLQKLWDGAKELQSLKTISLRNSQKLVEINQLSEAHNLEQIDLRGCTSLQSFEATGNLEHLQVLNLCGCVQVKSFPNVLPPNIKELNLNGTGIREVPETIVALSKLVKLDLGNCKELLNFLIKIYNMESLELLNLSGCIELKSFPEIAKEVGKLHYLYLSCTGIQELHTSISNMIGLKVLEVSKNLNLPESLKSLKDLKVEYKEETEDLL